MRRAVAHLALPLNAAHFATRACESSAPFPKDAKQLRWPYGASDLSLFRDYGDDSKAAKCLSQTPDQFLSKKSDGGLGSTEIAHGSFSACAFRTRQCLVWYTTKIKDGVRL